MDILIYILLLLASVVITYFITKAKFHSLINSFSEKYNLLDKEKAIAVSALDEKKDQLKITERKLEEERLNSKNLSADLSEAKTMNQNLNEKLDSQEKELRIQFENLANAILDKKSEKFTEQNRKNLDTILDPLKEKIKAFEEKVEKAYNEDMREKTSLKTQIQILFDQSKKISDEANNLATALKGDNKQQGNWGEIILEKILERSGLIKDQEYKTQFVTTNDEGDRIKPDVVIFLPDEKHIIIDSKVSLVAYDAFVNAADEVDRLRFRKAHIDSVRSHIKLLGEKNYQTALGLSTPDFILLFIPIESSFSVAIQADQDLFNYAWDRKIVMVSPSTLLATLRTVSSIWKQERQTRNALQIAEEGGKLYDKFVGFVEDLMNVGKKMDSAKVDYVEAMKKLTDGSGNLVRRAEKMKELGAKAGKSLPQQIIERAE
ncbi:MAG TPA: DNA recombination protein RmuC [Bacteroidia bacterium]|nr:DNA recombination protein RmuC [Bacteroidia bacterium]